MTVRNIRAHQSRGLLPTPEIRGRTGYYGLEHVTRLELISEMQADGFNLQAIKRLVDVSDGSGEEVLGFKRALMAPFEQESPEFIEQADLNERWGALDGELLAKAERLGLIRPLGEGRFEVPSPTLYRAGEQLLALGVEPRTVLATSQSRSCAEPKRSRRTSSSCSWRRCGSRSWRPGDPRRNGRACARRWSGCARWRPKPCWHVPARDDARRGAGVRTRAGRP